MNILNNITCVFFDHDGTLVDSEVSAVEVSLELIKQIDQSFGLPPCEKEELIIGRTFKDDLRDRFAQKNIHLSDDFLRFLILEEERRAIATMKKCMKPTPGAIKTLKTLHKSEMPMAIISNSTTNRLRESLSVLKLNKIIPPCCIFSTQDSFEDGISRPKPAPDIHYLALKKLNQK